MLNANYSAYSRVNYTTKSLYVKCICSCEGVIKYSQVTHKLMSCEDHMQQPHKPYACTCDVALELYFI